MKLPLFLSILVVFFMGAGPSYAGSPILYQDGDTPLEGYLAVPDETQFKGSRPAVLVIHQWKGLGPYEKRRADMLAEQGYIAFAVDIYGQGIRPETTEAAAAESSRYKNAPMLARGRLHAALEKVKSLPRVNSKKIAVIGYCFGGTMALEAARSAADIEAAVSFHGGLATKAKAGVGDVKAALQVHHGAADPYVSAEEVNDFKEEMTRAEADWHFISYAEAVHAFTEKEAGNDPAKGVAYNAKADQRSWAYTLVFLQQRFSP